MATKTFKAFERDNRSFVTGKTVIDHQVRLKLNLSFREYTVLATVMTFREGKQKNEGITYGNFWIASGIKPAHVQRAFITLKEKGLLIKDEAGLVQVTDKFKKEFTVNGNFEEFWKIEPKGTKLVARKMYDKAIRIKTHEQLCENYRKYIAFCNESNRFKKDTSTWLNPTSGFIDAEWIGEKPVEKNTEKPDPTKAPETLEYDFLNPNKT